MNLTEATQRGKIGDFNKSVIKPNLEKPSTFKSPFGFKRQPSDVSDLNDREDDFQRANTLLPEINASKSILTNSPLKKTSARTALEAAGAQQVLKE